MGARDTFEQVSLRSLPARGPRRGRVRRKLQVDAALDEADEIINGENRREGESVGAD